MRAEMIRNEHCEGHVAAGVSGVQEAGMPRGATTASCPFVTAEGTLISRSD